MKTSAEIAEEIETRKRADKVHRLVRFLSDCGFTWEKAAAFEEHNWKAIALQAGVNPPSETSIRHVVAWLKDPPDSIKKDQQNAP